MCAQRLSASWIVSHYHSQTRERPHGPVLNACRRHGSFHRRSFSPFAGSFCAQRLSASWIVSRYTGAAVPPPPPRAQRLSASWIVSRRFWPNRQHRRTVLNACRRHGSFHGPTSDGLRHALAVLNACRRHGSFHVCRSRRRARSALCSTPVGVMDRFTRTESFPESFLTRAQRLSASWIVSRVAKDLKVSEGNGCAQRLSASWIVSHERNFRAWTVGHVLNACRRHGSFHDAAANGKVKIIECSTPVGVMDRFTTGFEPATS